MTRFSRGWLTNQFLPRAPSSSERAAHNQKQHDDRYEKQFKSGRRCRCDGRSVTSRAPKLEDTGQYYAHTRELSDRRSCETRFDDHESADDAAADEPSPTNERPQSTGAGFHVAIFALFA
jgi:hypothetical protein